MFLMPRPSTPPMNSEGVWPPRFSLPKENLRLISHTEIALINFSLSGDSIISLWRWLNFSGLRRAHNNIWVSRRYFMKKEVLLQSFQNYQVYKSSPWLADHQF